MLDTLFKRTYTTVWWQRLSLHVVTELHSDFIKVLRKWQYISDHCLPNIMHFNDIYIFMCMYMCMNIYTQQHKCGGQRTTRGSQLYPEKVIFHKNISWPQETEVSSLLQFPPPPPCRFWGSDLGCLAWHHTPSSPAEPSQLLPLAHHLNLGTLGVKPNFNEESIPVDVNASLQL